MSYELALNQDIQERLRREITEYVDDHNLKNLTYDALKELKYLDMVFKETLRKWPVVDSHIRKCSRDFPIPNSKLVIPAESMIWISAYALQNDERYWHEPEKFNPERFNEQNIKKIVPYTYIPFSEGPR